MGLRGGNAAGWSSCCCGVGWLPIVFVVLVVDLLLCGCGGGCGRRLNVLSFVCSGPGCRRVAHAVVRVLHVVASLRAWQLYWVWVGGEVALGAGAVGNDEWWGGGAVAWLRVEVAAACVCMCLWGGRCLGVVVVESVECSGCGDCRPRVVVWARGGRVFCLRWW